MTNSNPGEHSGIESAYPCESKTRCATSSESYRRTDPMPPANTLESRMSRVFLGRRGVGTMTDRRHHGKGQHDERDMAMPAVPGSGLVVIEAELGLGSLEAVLDGPAMAFDPDQRLDRLTHHCHI